MTIDDFFPPFAADSWFVPGIEPGEADQGGLPHGQCRLGRRGQITHDEVRSWLGEMADL
jgi:hypothetical protein